MQNLIPDVWQMIYKGSIRVNNPSLDRNIGKYHLRVLIRFVYQARHSG